MILASTHETKLSYGTLFIIATPIGNSTDLSQRAITSLCNVNLIASEDTRITRRLLNEHKITPPQILSYNNVNEIYRSEILIKKLCSGENIALVSDAGMPLISDPGFRLIKKVKEIGIPLVVIPGASAITTALAYAGFSAQQFVFLGYLPKKNSARQKSISQVSCWEAPLVLFLSPHRLVQELQCLLAILTNRNCCICREITKKYEEILYLTLEEAIIHFTRKQAKGEFTVVIEGYQ